MKAMISNIVFTKNRPLQLDGYLRSLHKFFGTDSVKTYIIWKEELFAEQYQELFSEFSKCTVRRETNFSDDFFDILSGIDTKYILFGIDDVVYFDSVDFDVIDKTFDCFDDIFGFSLRLGGNVLNSGVDGAKKIDIDGQEVYKMSWPKGRTKNIRYPFELCATIYRTELIKKIIDSSRSHNHLAERLFWPNSFLIILLRKVRLARKVLKRLGFFYNPNTLESWVCRWCQKNSDRLPSFICFQKQCACAVQVNMVNVSTNNEFDSSSEFTVEALNEKYKQGYRLDLTFAGKGVPQGTHCGAEYFRLLMKEKN
jgi:hypothetical protein